MKIMLVMFAAVNMMGNAQTLRSSPPGGYVIGWGWNMSASIASPARRILGDVTAVRAGRFQCLALKNDGTVVSWGNNSRNGMLTDDTILTAGDGGIVKNASSNLTQRKRITIVTNGIVQINGAVLSNVVSIATGIGFSSVLKRDGSVISWGNDWAASGPSNIVVIAAAGYSDFAVRSDGGVIQWEGAKWSPGHGQLDAVPGLSNVVALAIGESPQGTRNLALGSDGTVAHWGEETRYKDATPPAGLSNVIAVAAGYNHSLALKSDGTVIGWGFNNVGQATGIVTTNVPAISEGQVTIGGQILNNVVSIAAGKGYSMALKNDGTVVAWGRMVNDLYPANVPVALSNVVAIAAGENFCLAITTNAAVADRFSR